LDGSTPTSMSRTAALASKTAKSHSAENGQPLKRLVRHQSGHFHRGVVALILATTAAVFE
jgi:hypothetical protein